MIRFERKTMDEDLFHNLKSIDTLYRNLIPNWVILHRMLDLGAKNRLVNKPFFVQHREHAYHISIN